MNFAVIALNFIIGILSCMYLSSQGVSELSKFIISILAFQLPLGGMYDYIIGFLTRTINSEYEKRAQKQIIKRMLPAIVLSIGLLSILCGFFVNVYLAGIGASLILLSENIFIYGLREIEEDNKINRIISRFSLVLIIVVWAIGFWGGFIILKYLNRNERKIIFGVLSFISLIVVPLIIYFAYKKILTTTNKSMLEEMFVYQDKNGNLSDSDGNTIYADFGMKSIKKSKSLTFLLIVVSVAVTVFLISWISDYFGMLIFSVPFISVILNEATRRGKMIYPQLVGVVQGIMMLSTLLGLIHCILF